MGNFEKRTWPKIENNALNESIAFAELMIKYRSRLETNIINAGVGLLKSTPSHSQYVYSYPSEDAFEKSNDAIIAAKASSYLVQNSCRRYFFKKKFPYLNRFKHFFFMSTCIFFMPLNKLFLKFKNNKTIILFLS